MIAWMVSLSRRWWAQGLALAATPQASFGKFSSRAVRSAQHRSKGHGPRWGRKENQYLQAKFVDQACPGTFQDPRMYLRTDFVGMCNFQRRANIGDYLHRRIRRALSRGCRKLVFTLVVQIICRLRIHAGTAHFIRSFYRRIGWLVL